MHMTCRPRRDARFWRPEYAIEGALLGLFMVAAAALAVLLEHPASMVRQMIAGGSVRRLIMGAGMAATAAALIYSPWGRRSGAHMNPATTLTFAWLGWMCPFEACGYIAAQFAGGVAGMGLAALLLGAPIAHPAVAWVVTKPGPWGIAPAFAAEATMTAVLMGAGLALSTKPAWQSLSGVAAAVLVGTFIAIEAPVSGMSLNPARTLGSAVFAGDFTALWVYFTAPVCGMLLAAGTFRAATRSEETGPRAAVAAGLTERFDRSHS
jgi:aquaporin Z